MQCLDKDLWTRKWFRLCYFLLQISKPGLQRKSLHKDQIVLSSCELIIALLQQCYAPTSTEVCKVNNTEDNFWKSIQRFTGFNTKMGNYHIPLFAIPGNKQCPCPVDIVHSYCLCETLQRGKRSSNSINSSSFMRFRKWNFLYKKHLSSCITGPKQSFPQILGNRLGCASEVGAASFGWTLASKPVGLRAWSQVCPGARDFARNGRRQHWETTRHSSSGKTVWAH